MKRLISMFLAVLLMMSVSSVALAVGGSFYEEQALKDAGIVVKCEKCGDACTGKFGCTCCEECPGRVDSDGIALNIGDYLECRYGYYFDSDVYSQNADGSSTLVHNGDFKMHYYWKPLCCEECTGKKGCTCNNVDYETPCGCPCCYYEPDHLEERIEEGVEKGRQGFTNGIQGALATLRDLMYDFFNRIFEFLRIDVILGKDRVPTGG